MPSIIKHIFVKHWYLLASSRPSHIKVSIPVNIKIFGNIVRLYFNNNDGE